MTIYKNNGCVMLLRVMVVALIPMIVMGQNGTIDARNQTSTKLRILIPVRPGLTKFVAIERHPITGVQNFSGFAIEVFEEIVSFGLPSPVPYEFIPFANADGVMNGTFDDMLKEVSSQVRMVLPS